MRCGGVGKKNGGWARRGERGCGGSAERREGRGREGMQGRFVCLLFYVLATLQGHQEGYRLVIVPIHDDFIVLSHWETRPSAP